MYYIDLTSRALVGIHWLGIYLTPCHQPHARMMRFSVSCITFAAKSHRTYAATWRRIGTFTLAIAAGSTTEETFEAGNGMEEVDNSALGLHRGLLRSFLTSLNVTEHSGSCRPSHALPRLA